MQPTLPIDRVIRLLDAHCPSLTVADEQEIDRRASRGDDASELALRTCSCGLRVNGFYEYCDHLKEIMATQHV